MQLRFSLSTLHQTTSDPQNFPVYVFNRLFDPVSRTEVLGNFPHSRYKLHPQTMHKKQVTEELDKILRQTAQLLF
jgi:hypothetical protein